MCTEQAQQPLGLQRQLTAGLPVGFAAQGQAEERGCGSCSLKPDMHCAMRVYVYCVVWAGLCTTFRLWEHLYLEV